MGADKRVRLDQITLLGMQCGKPSKNENKPNPKPLIRDGLYHCKKIGVVCCWFQDILQYLQPQFHLFLLSENRSGLRVRILSSLMTCRRLQMRHPPWMVHVDLLETQWSLGSFPFVLVSPLRSPTGLRRCALGCALLPHAQERGSRQKLDSTTRVLWVLGAWKVVNHPRFLIFYIRVCFKV